MRSLAWLPDDTKLVSAGVDGAVYEWRLKDFKRSKENVLKVRLMQSAVQHLTLQCLLVLMPSSSTTLDSAVPVGMPATTACWLVSC